MMTLADIQSRVAITVEEAGALIGVRRSAAYEAARRGQLPTRRVGRRLLVPVPAFLRWLGDGPATDDPPYPEESEAQLRFARRQP